MSKYSKSVHYIISQNKQSNNITLAMGFDYVCLGLLVFLKTFFSYNQLIDFIKLKEKYTHTLFAL